MLTVVISLFVYLYTLQIDTSLVIAVGLWSLAVATPVSCALPSCHTTTYFFFFPLFTVLTMDGPGGVGDWRPGEDGLR